MSVDLDKQIDRAVREMLDVEPPANLRARVIAQLPASAEATAGRPASGSRLPVSGFRLPASGWVLAPLAAAAIIVVAVFIARRSEPIAQGPVGAHGPDVQLPNPVASGPPVRLEPGTASDPRSRAAVSRPARPSAPADVVAAADLPSAETTNIAALTPLSPIGMSPIVEHSIAPAEVAVRPLSAIADVQIAPLTPSERR